MLADIATEFAGVTEDFLPVLSAHPAIVIDALDTMLLDLHRALLGIGRIGRQAGEQFLEWVGHGGFSGCWFFGFGPAGSDCQDGDEQENAVDIMHGVAPPGDDWRARQDSNLRPPD